MSIAENESSLIVGVNTYVGLDDASELARFRSFSRPWQNASTLDQSQALATATALLDRLRWQGRPLTPTQRLAWPRVPQGCPPGYPLTVDIPEEIRTACVELAAHLLSVGQMPGGAAIQQQMLGDSMVMYFAHVADELPKHVRRLIEPHLRVSSANVAEVTF